MNGVSQLGEAIKTEIELLDAIVAKVDELVDPLDLPEDSVFRRHWTNRRTEYVAVADLLKEALSHLPPQG